MTQEGILLRKYYAIEAPCTEAKVSAVKRNSFISSSFVWRGRILTCLRAQMPMCRIWQGGEKVGGVASFG